jgi:hypothetical protein
VAWFFGGGAMLSVSRALGRRLFSTGDLAAGVEEGALLRGGVAAAGGRWRRSGEAVAQIEGRRRRSGEEGRGGSGVAQGKKGIFC